jgi:hypothetical protein
VELPVSSTGKQYTNSAKTEFESYQRVAKIEAAAKSVNLTKTSNPSPLSWLEALIYQFTDARKIQRSKDSS